MLRQAQHDLLSFRINYFTFIINVLAGKPAPFTKFALVKESHPYTIFSAVSPSGIFTNTLSSLITAFTGTKYPLSFKILNPIKGLLSDVFNPLLYKKLISISFPFFLHLLPMARSVQYLLFHRYRVKPDQPFLIPPVFYWDNAHSPNHLNHS